MIRVYGCSDLYFAVIGFDILTICSVSQVFQVEGVESFDMLY